MGGGGARDESSYSCDSCRGSRKLVAGGQKENVETYVYILPGDQLIGRLID